MRPRLLLLPAVLTFSLGLASGLFAQTPPEPPSVGDLKEEQRIITNAYLARAENFVSKSKEQITDDLLRPAKENGFYAVELLSRARKRLDVHPSRIEQARGIFGRASESTREELRRNLREKIDPRYFALQASLESLAAKLAAKGDSSLQQGVDAAKVGDTARVEQIMRGQGIIPQESPSNSIPPGGSSGGGFGPGSGSSLPQPPGTASADGNYVDTAFGRVDLRTGVKLPDGSIAYQSDQGVVVLGPDGQWRPIRGGKLNSDGSVTLANGQNVPAAQVGSYSVSGGSGAGGSGMSGSSGGSGSGGSGMGGFSGLKPDDKLIDAATGQAISRTTVGPDWDGKPQVGVSKDYIGGAGATLVSETKMTREVVGGGDGVWKVKQTPGESRSWNLTIRTGDQKSANGTVTLTATVDGGGSNGFLGKPLRWEVVDNSGNRAAAAPSSSNPAEAVITITKGGSYTFTASGETDWGSPFRVKVQGDIYP